MQAIVIPMQKEPNFLPLQNYPNTVTVDRTSTYKYLGIHTLSIIEYACGNNLRRHFTNSWLLPYKLKIGIAGYKEARLSNTHQT